MNLSFSTRGWQSFSFEENIKTATEMEFGGIEIMYKSAPLLPIAAARSISIIRRRP